MLATTWPRATARTWQVAPLARLALAVERDHPEQLRDYDNAIGTLLHPGRKEVSDKAIAEALAEVDLPAELLEAGHTDAADDELKLSHHGAWTPSATRWQLRDRRERHGTVRSGDLSAPEGEQAGYLFDGFIRLTAYPGLLRGEAHPHRRPHLRLKPVPVDLGRFGYVDAMRVHIAADHAAYDLKDFLVKDRRPPAMTWWITALTHLSRPTTIRCSSCLVPKRGSRPRQSRDRPGWIGKRGADRGQQGQGRTGRPRLQHGDVPTRPRAQRCRIVALGRRMPSLRRCRGHGEGSSRRRSRTTRHVRSIDMLDEYEERHGS